jgi:hypothetical protein
MAKRHLSVLGVTLPGGNLRMYDSSSGIAVLLDAAVAVAWPWKYHWQGNKASRQDGARYGSHRGTP